MFLVFRNKVLDPKPKTPDMYSLFYITWSEQ